MAGVILKDVVKVYEGGVRVVDRVNLSIADHEFVVLVGRPVAANRPRCG
jgi:multiple sugar transport system ATP-binding protein